MGTLAFRPSGTKLAFRNHRTELFHPGWFQGVQRYWSNGASHEDLHNLLNPLIVCSSWYNCEEYPCLEPVYKASHQGLETLAETYEKTHPVASHALAYYVEILRNPGKVRDRYDGLQGNFLYKCFRGFWQKEEIALLADLFSRAQGTDSPRTRRTYVDTLERILVEKEERVEELVTGAVQGDTMPTRTAGAEEQIDL